MSNSEATVIAANGKVWYAPTTAAMPTDATTAMSAVDALYVELGFVSADGVTTEVGADQQMLEAWNNGGYAVRRYVTGRSCKQTFTLEQFDSNTIPFAFGGGEITGGGLNEKVDVALTGFSGTDSFKITFGGNESAIITRGTNYTVAGIEAVFNGIAGFTGSVIVTAVSDSGFSLEFTGDYANTNVGAVTITSGVGVTGIATVTVTGAASGGTAFTYTPPGNSDAVPQYVLVIDWEDGDRNFRSVIPIGSVTNSPSFSLTRTDALLLPIEFEATPDGSTDAYRMFSDDSAWS